PPVARRRAGADPLADRRAGHPAPQQREEDLRRLHQQPHPYPRRLPQPGFRGAVAVQEPLHRQQADPPTAGGRAAPGCDRRAPEGPPDRGDRLMLSNKGQVIECLLQGAFICRTTDEDGWRFLKNPANREQVDDYLNTLNRVVASVGSGAEAEVFYCAYRQLGENQRKVVGQQFRDVCNALTPLVEWLLLVQEASSQDAPLTEGSPIRLNELQGIVEDTPAFREQLARISHYRFFGSTSSSVDMQIKQVFKKLCEQGYLVRPNPEKQIYIGTGKLDYLYRGNRFTDEAEGLALEERAEAASQSSLL